MENGSESRTGALSLFVPRRGPKVPVRSIRRLFDHFTQERDFQAIKNLG